MNTSMRRGARLVPVLACLAGLGPVAGAQASDGSLRAVLKSSIPKVSKSQTKLLSSLSNYEKTHNAKPVISAIKAQDNALRALEAKVSDQAPSSTKGAKAKSDIVTGLGLIVGSNTTLAKAFQKASQHKPVSKSQVAAATKAARKGNVDVNAGLKLLKI